MDLLDNDFYQFTMSQYAWRHHPQRVVRYRFRNRSFSVPLGDALDLPTLRARLDALSGSAFSPADLAVLRATGLFDEPYLEALAGLPGLPAVAAASVDGHLEITYEGPWHAAIFLETPVLATVSQLYYERFRATTTEGERRLDAKIRHLRENPALRFMEFGSRHRYSFEWQRHVLTRLLEEVPAAVIGSSNVTLAAEAGIPALGTMAHQLFMVEAALDQGSGPDLVGSGRRVVDRWQAMYPGLLTLLPDTYTSAFLLPHVDEAARWPAVRLDSGDPMLIGRLVLDWWRRNGEDPQSHRLVFSDALDLRTMSLLHDGFEHLTDVTFGWGTNLTNDLGFETLSLVIKPDAVDGIPCVKLSDDIVKATGPRHEIRRYARLVGLSTPDG